MLDKLFDAAPSFLQALAPEGWPQSPYVQCLHPTPQQQHDLFAFTVGDNNNDDAGQDPSQYDPGEAVKAELEKKEKEAELKKIRDKSENSFQKEYKEAKYKPPVPVVQAYKNVFGKLPDGHPQKEFE